MNHYSPNRYLSLSPPPSDRYVTRWLLSIFAFSVLAGPVVAATPTPEIALKFKPTRPEVEYDRPSSNEVARCIIKPLQASGVKGWVVLDAAGQTLRRFVDSNGDNVVDQWCYFLNGIEVYRDVDSNFNRKVDQHRWLNTAGMRWGFDRNEDGTTDHWQAISAQEVTAELIRAIGTRDINAFQRLLVSSDELKKLGLGASVSSKIVSSIGAATAKFKKLTRDGATITPATKWVHFSATRPGVVPAGTDGSVKDVQVYENVVAMVETNGNQGFVQVGTMLKVGDAWRLVDAPVTSNDQTSATSAAGLFFQADSFQQAQIPENPQVDGVGEQLQELLGELEKIEGRIAAAPASGHGALYGQQADILEKLSDAASNKAQQTAWLKQLADNLSAGVQSGHYAAGVERLATLAKKLEVNKTDKAVAAYVRYRGLLAEYSVAMQDPKADFAKIQTQWLSDLNAFIDKYPGSEDAAEAILQIAIAEEFAGEEENAKEWYRKLVSQAPTSPQARKAAGAVRRLDSVGKPLSFAGKSINGRTIDLSQFRGRTVLLHYWATWCEPCKADMVTIRSLVAKYGRKKFSVVGVNVDNDAATATSYLQQQRFTWSNIHEPGGLESRPATELGVLTLPTMILIDRKGRVVNRNIHVSELETELKKRK